MLWPFNRLVLAAFIALPQGPTWLQDNWHTSPKPAGLPSQGRYLLLCFVFLFFERKGLHLKDFLNNSLTSKMTLSVFKTADPDCPVAMAEVAVALHRGTAAIFSPSSLPGGLWERAAPACPCPSVSPTMIAFLHCPHPTTPNTACKPRPWAHQKPLQLGVNLPPALPAPLPRPRGGGQAQGCPPQPGWLRHPGWLSQCTEKDLHVFLIPPLGFKK